MTDAENNLRDLAAIDSHFGRIINQLQAENERLKPFETAIKKRHNGYDPEAAKELGIEPPESPEQALQDLQDEWDNMETSYADDIVKLKKENERLTEKIKILELAEDLTRYTKEQLQENERLKRRIDKLKQALDEATKVDDEI